MRKPEDEEWGEKPGYRDHSMPTQDWMEEPRYKQIFNEIEDKILTHLGLREAEVPEGVDPRTGEVEF